MMVMKISSKSPSRQRSGTLSGENAVPPIFSGQRVYVGGRRGQGDGRAVLTTGGRS
jgi:hypothetical protein